MLIGNRAILDALNWTLVLATVGLVWLYCSQLCLVLLAVQT